VVATVVSLRLVVCRAVVVAAVVVFGDAVTALPVVAACVATSVTVGAVVEGVVVVVIVVSRRPSSVTDSGLEVGETLPGPDGVCALLAVDDDNVEAVGDRNVFTVVCREVFLVRAGTVVFHLWVEKGMVMLAGSVTSWSPSVDSSDSGTVGRSQAGRLLTDSSAGRGTTRQINGHRRRPAVSSSDI